MGLFSGIKDKKVSKQGKFLTADASYDLEIETMLVHKSRSKGWAFIAEFKVLSVSGSEEAIEKHPIGSSASWFQSLQDEDIGLGAVKGFMAALLGEDPEDEEFNESLEEVLEQATDKVEPGEEHMFKGEKIHVDTVGITTKKDQPFTRHNWSHLAD